MAHIFSDFDFTDKTTRVLVPGYPKASQDKKSNWSVQYEFLVGSVYPDISIPIIGTTIDTKLPNYRDAWINLTVTAVSITPLEDYPGILQMSIAYGDEEYSYTWANANRPNKVVELDGQTIDKDSDSHATLTTMQKSTLKEAGVTSYQLSTIVYRRTTYPKAMPNTADEALNDAGKLQKPTRCRWTDTTAINWLKQPTKWTKNGNTVVKVEEWLYSEGWDTNIYQTAPA